MDAENFTDLKLLFTLFIDAANAMRAAGKNGTSSTSAGTSGSRIGGSGQFKKLGTVLKFPLFDGLDALLCGCLMVGDLMRLLMATFGSYIVKKGLQVSVACHCTHHL